MSQKDKLIIFDTTLRDGEQSPGASMTRDEKVRIAKALERMRVDVIEAGFPIASPGDFEAVQAVARSVTGSTVCGLARALDKDIDRAGEALKPAAASRIHTFIATSPIHMKMKLRMEPEQVIGQAVRAGELPQQQEMEEQPAHVDDAEHRRRDVVDRQGVRAEQLAHRDHDDEGREEQTHERGQTFDQTMMTNIMGTYYLLQACLRREIGIERFTSEQRVEGLHQRARILHDAGPNYFVFRSGWEGDGTDLIVWLQLESTERHMLVLSQVD